MRKPIKHGETVGEFTVEAYLKGRNPGGTMDTYCLLVVRKEDEPFLIVNPPADLDKLVKRWKKIDNKLAETVDRDLCPEWKPLETFLGEAGVKVLKPRIVRVRAWYHDPSLTK